MQKNIYGQNTKMLKRFKHKKFTTVKRKILKTQICSYCQKTKMLKWSKHKNYKTVKPQHFKDGQNTKMFKRSNGKKKISLVRTKNLKQSKCKKKL